MKINIKLEGGIMPKKGSEYAAAYDLYVPEDYILRLGRQIIDMGFILELPLWWKANIRPRSGFSAKGMQAIARTTYVHAVDIGKYERKTVEEEVRIDADVLLGLVDCDYHDHCGVMLKVNSLDYFAKKPWEFCDMVKNEIVLPKGLRIAQMEICKGEESELIEVSEVDMTNDRGGGFGHTGA